ncbi:MAG: demethoxyubiquinone hydroxylase family protein [candidate division NC10 bacterium]|nr:demethoxyubiquinone hydroxylase family protein [candidate division NC10 bacterium]
MEVRRPEDEQVPLLLRVGLGVVWVYEGLVPKLLAPSPDLLSLVARLQPLPGNPGAFLRAAGVFEILLGLLLIRGWMVRSVAAVQCALLVMITIGIGLAAPHALVHPAGAASKNVALLAASLCLVFLGSGRDVPSRTSWRDRAVPLILRLGLGFMWIYEGVVPKWLFLSPAGIEIVARTGLVPFHIPAFLKLLGVAEAALGFTILAGLWVRGMAVLQAGLLGAFTAILGWTSPATLADPLGSLSKNLGLLGGALALYRTGSGPWAVGAWLAPSPTWRRWLLLISLQWNRLIEIAAAEVYRVQARAAVDPNTHGLLEKLALDEVNHGQDLASLIRRHGGRPVPVAPMCRALGWIAGGLTVILGTRASLRLDLWLEERGTSLYPWSAGLLPPEAGITARSLLAMQNQEAQHVHLLRDHLRAMRAASRKRR